MERLKVSREELILCMTSIIDAWELMVTRDCSSKWAWRPRCHDCCASWCCCSERARVELVALLRVWR